MKILKKQSGFTLVEVIVSTAIFVTVVSGMLAIFNYTLLINRRVQSLREVVQGTRNFTETITRSIRNGHIDYSQSSPCSASNYALSTNQSLGILTKDSEKLCFYFANGKLNLRRSSQAGTSDSPLFGSANFTIDPSTFRFIVRPTQDPNIAPFPKIQPHVTIVGIFTLNQGAAVANSIEYQSTISTDVYDIKK